MLRGEISNKVGPAIMVVWEGVAAQVFTDHVRRGLRRSKDRRLRYIIDEVVEAALWRLMITTDINVEVVTFLGEKEAARISEIIKERNYPARWVRAFDSPGHLADRLAYEPWVMAVYDGDPRRQFTYGGLTRIVTQANRNMIGVF